MLKNESVMETKEFDFNDGSSDNSDSPRGIDRHSPDEESKDPINPEEANNRSKNATDSKQTFAA